MSWLGSRIKWIIGAGAAFVVALVLAFARKSGADAEKAKQARADNAAAGTIAAERTKAAGASDVDHQKGIEKWTKR